MGSERSSCDLNARWEILELQQGPGLERLGKNFGFYPEGQVCGGHPLFPKCFKLDSNLIRFEYLKDDCNYSVVIWLGAGWGWCGCGEISYRDVRGENLVCPGAGQWQ